MRDAFLIVGVLLLGFFALVALMSDPVIEFSSSGPILRPLDRECLIETLRMEKAVRGAGLLNGSRAYAELVIPKNLQGPSYPDADIEERRNDKKELEIVVSISFIPDAGTPEYQAYLQEALDDLRDRMIARCGGN